MKIGLIGCIAIGTALAILPPATDAIAAKEETERYQISVITMGPGQELFSRFGHIGLLVEDKEEATEKVYNFGMYDFSNPVLRLKYLKGFLIYWVSLRKLPSMVRQYSEEDRLMEQRVLNIAPEAAAGIAEKLAIIARPENREYAYRHFLNNCCTRIRDLVDEASGGAIAAVGKGKMNGCTYRDLTRMSLMGTITGAIGVDFILGPAGDKPIDRWAEEFLPIILAEDLDKAVGSGGVPLVNRKIVLHEREGPALNKVTEKWDIPALATLLFLIVLGLAAPIILGRSRPRLGARLAGIGLLTWAFIGGVGGAILTFLWTVTTHYDFHRNENLLCFLPTHLLLLVPALWLIVRGRISGKAGKLLARYLVLSAGIIVAGLLLKLRANPQNNYGFMAFCFGMNIVCLAALLRTGLARIRS
ncbi:MAG: DUF4105 domain-containing protein [Syntrophales bacterium]|nr:DUF4105 domain-containing protein [Syntrophales bacterium]